MSMKRKRAASKRNPIDAETRAKLDLNPHTKKRRGNGAKPWQHQALWLAHAGSGHVAGGSMYLR